MGFEKHNSLSQYLHFERQLTWPIRYLIEMHNAKAIVKTWTGIKLLPANVENMVSSE